ncbi:hypothetical protein BCE02nite_46680 [Brevibacillus centrosporus]|nr:hypothetical protein BCE02nite_46680 [Brevibacillus centrosporus]
MICLFIEPLVVKVKDDRLLLISEELELEYHGGETLLALGQIKNPDIQSGFQYILYDPNTLKSFTACYEQFISPSGLFPF